VRGFPVNDELLNVPDEPERAGHAGEFSVTRSMLDDGAALIALKGECDLSNVDAFRAELDAAQADGASGVVVDLEQVDFIDSTYLGALLGANERLTRGGGRLAITRAQPVVRRTFETARMESVLSLFDAVGPARDHIRGGPA
jgi:anti-anti-sigma factor